MANLCLLSFVFLVTHHVYASDVLTKVNDALAVRGNEIETFCTKAREKSPDIKLNYNKAIKNETEESKAIKRNYNNAINTFCKDRQRNNDNVESATELLSHGHAAIDYLNGLEMQIKGDIKVSEFVNSIVAFIREATQLARTVLAQHEISKLQEAEKTQSVLDHMKETHFYIPRELTERNVFKEFIEWKLKSGSNTEKIYYEQFGATPEGEQKFIASLISKRTRMFVGKLDLTLLREEHSNITIWLPWHHIGDEKWEKHTAKKGGPSNRDELKKLWKEWVDEVGVLHNGEYHEDYTLYQMEKNADKFPFEDFSIYNYLSYDEMQLAALMIVAGPTTFYSNCRDKYANRKYREGEFVKNGYIVGIVGPRLELPGVMDFSLLSPSTEEKDNELRAIVYGKQYEGGLPPSRKGGRYIMVEWKKGNDEKAMPRALRERAFIGWANGNKTGVAPPPPAVIKVPIHLKLFKERLKITFGAYFDFVHKTMLELNKGKKKEDLKKAYVIVLPIGAGAWALGAEVNEYIFPPIQTLLQEREYAQSIGTIHLTGDPRVWQTVTVPKVNGVNICMEVISGPTATQKKNSAGQLENIDPKTVRFFAFPWDSNALPGNEFWFPVSTNWHGVGDKKTATDMLDGLVGGDNGVLQWSGDPAAACCSDIIFTQNWIHNKKLSRADGKQPDWQRLGQAPNARRLQAQQENAKEEEMNIDRELLTSGLTSYSFYSVGLVTVVLATAMFIVSFFWRVV